MQIRLTYEDPVSRMWSQKNFFTSVVDPVDLELLCDNVAILYSNLLINPILLRFSYAYYDSDLSAHVAGDEVNLNGARITFDNPAFPSKTSCFYYWVKYPDNKLSRRVLYWSHYYNEVVDGYMIDSLYDYLVEHLTLLYDTDGVILKDEQYRVMKFHHLSRKLFNRKGFRYPNRHFTLWWPGRPLPD